MFFMQSSAVQIVLLIYKNNKNTNTISHLEFIRFIKLKLR